MTLFNILNNSNNGVVGSLSGTYTDDEITYRSTIDSEITNLKYQYCYDDGLKNMPLLILMHGWTDDYETEFTQDVMQKFASYKYFAVAVNMRGRSGALGNKDASGRELYDIFDAINEVKNRFVNLIDSKINVIAGWSGGGGNVLGMVSKFPDLFNASIDNFGMSDYGHSLTYGWYYTNTSYSASILATLGDPATNKNEYLSRKHVDSASNNQGYLYMFQDDADTGVSVEHSRQVVANMTKNYVYSETSSVDVDRWIHSAPTIGAAIEKAESIWKDAAKEYPRLTVPKADSMLIRGYLITKRFTIWLGDGVTQSKNGTNRSASLVYNVDSDSYTVIPILDTGATDLQVIIVQGDKTATQIISTETEIIVT